MEPGDRLIFLTAGGGGWGDPRERDTAAIADDVAKGYVSEEAAQRDYGFAAGTARTTRRRSEGRAGP